MTKQQRALLNFVESYIEQRGHSPSFIEIAEGLGYGSTNTVAKHVRALVDQGRLMQRPGRNRSLAVLPFEHDLAPVPTEQLIAEVERRLARMRAELSGGAA